MNFINGLSESVKKMLVLILLLVVVYFAVNYIVKRYKSRNVGKSSYNKANINPAVNYDNLANLVHTTFSKSWFLQSGSDIENVSKQLLSLNDDELKYTYNRYDDLFGKGNSTMYSDMQTFVINAPSYDALLLRMEKLSLL